MCETKTSNLLVIEDLRFDTKIKKIYIRYNIILILADGYNFYQIATILGISEKMVQRVAKLFEVSGIDGLATFHYRVAAESYRMFREGSSGKNLKDICTRTLWSDS